MKERVEASMATDFGRKAKRSEAELAKRSEAEFSVYYLPSIHWHTHLCFLDTRMNATTDTTDRARVPDHAPLPPTHTRTNNNQKPGVNALASWRVAELKRRLVHLKFFPAAEAIALVPTIPLGVEALGDDVRLDTLDDDVTYKARPRPVAAAAAAAAVV